MTRSLDSVRADQAWEWPSNKSVRAGLGVHVALHIVRLNRYPADTHPVSRLEAGVLHV